MDREKQMQSLVKTAKSVDDAVNEALIEMNCSLDDVNIEILEEARSGLFGLIGSRDAIVRVSLKQDAMSATRVDDSFSASELSNPTSEAEASTSEAGAAESEEEVSEENAANEEMPQPEELVSSSEPAPEVGDAAEKAVSPAEEPEAVKPPQKELDAVQNEEPKFVSSEADEVNMPADEETAKESEEKPEQTADAAVLQEETKTLLSALLAHMHISASVRCTIDQDNLVAEIFDITDEDMGIVIGRRAETLNAMQYLLSVAVNRRSQNHLRVFLDVGGYRSRRKANIEKIARRNAEKVQRFKKPISLEPMNAYERRIVHYALQDMRHITTISEGKDPYRKVVIQYEK